MDDCRKCKLKEICHSLPEDMTCEEVEIIAKDGVIDAHAADQEEMV